MFSIFPAPLPKYRVKFSVDADGKASWLHLPLENRWAIVGKTNDDRVIVQHPETHQRIVVPMGHLKELAEW
jgi:hypothetical protein